MKTNKHYLSRDLQPEVKKSYNLKSVLEQALQEHNTLRLNDRPLNNWFTNLHKSTQELLFVRCKELDIQIVM
jgi:hypothetical protein